MPSSKRKRKSPSGSVYAYADCFSAFNPVTCFTLAPTADALDNGFGRGGLLHGKEDGVGQKHSGAGVVEGTDIEAGESPQYVVHTDVES